MEVESELRDGICSPREKNAVHRACTACQCVIPERLDSRYVEGLRAFVALTQHKLHLLAFLQ